jgi:hypothetical protein
VVRFYGMLRGPCFYWSWPHLFKWSQATTLYPDLYEVFLYTKSKLSALPDMNCVMFQMLIYHAGPNPVLNCQH